MKGAPRAFRVACHAAAVAWTAAFLVGSYRQARFLADASERAAQEPATPAEALARIRPRPEAERADAAPPAATPPPTARASPEPAPPEPVSPGDRAEPISAGDLARGVALLDDAGSFPVLTCSYESFPSFLAYARAMASLGARFVVVRRREIVASIDVETGAIAGAALGAAFSPRARDYTDEPGLAKLARRARERFGQGAVVMMIVPREIDAGLFGGIARMLAARGDRHDAYREIRGRYERARRGVRLRLDAGIRPDGTRVAMDLLFDLGEIARTPGAAPGGSA